jgi:flagellar protein FliS
VTGDGAEAARLRYLAEAVQTATPGTRVAMLFDALVSDLAKADDAMAARDWKETSERLCHAQEILLVLASTLRTDLWPPAETLARLYWFLHQKLVAANLAKDRALLATCRAMIDKLASAWRQAAAVLAAGEASAVGTAGARA